MRLTKPQPKKRSRKPIKKITDIFRDPVYCQVILTSVLIVVSIIIIFAMTAAWYTNVISADGLDFTASEWGFEGNVDITSELVEAYPGSSGIVPLSVSNPTEQIISVSVDVAKTQMDVDLQQRIFFYVDDSRTVNNETLERVYINSLGSYEYTLFPNQQLLVSSQTNNVSPLKWEWTFDVLGYYFKGTVTPSTNSVEEYLFPVSYDYDAATFDDDGKLLTTDGTKTAAEFISEISLADGFEGVVDPETTVSGCYPVEVDETGAGVWLYLCNYGEIEIANEKDTLLGDTAAAGTGAVQFSAALSVIGQQKQYQTLEVNSVQEFSQALSDTTTELISVPFDITFDSMITVPDGTDKIINCNGNTIESVFAGDMFKVDGSSLSIIDGTLKGPGGSSYAVKVTNGDVSLNNVTITDVGSAVYIRDNLSSGEDSTVHLSNCNITTSDSSVFICGNGTISGKNTTLTVDNSTINSGTYFGIGGNGTEGWWGTEIQIRNSEIHGYWAGIYQPQRIAKLVITDSTVSGYTGIAVKGGTIEINNSTITGIDTTEGAVPPSAPAFSNSGYSDTGDGIYIETNYNYPISISITGENTVIDGFSGYAVRQFEPDATHVSAVITGGSFNSDVSAFLPLTHQCTLTDGRYIVSEKSELTD